MEDNNFNQYLNIVHSIVDQQICEDCEHPVCINKAQASAKRIEHLIQQEVRAARSKTLRDITVWANNEMAKDHVALKEQEKGEV